MSIGDLNKEIKRLSGLVQNKDTDISQLTKQAQLNVWKRQVSIGSKFNNADDKKLAEKLFDEYVENYVISSFSDMNTLADLVFEEVLKENLQSQITKITDDPKANFIPEKTIKSLHDTETRVFELKKKIGIDKESNDSSPLNALEQLIKRFKRYIPFMRHEFNFICPSCGEPTLLRRRVKDFDALKHPFFSGRFYYNARGIALVKEGIWTREQYAFAFFTSPEYVDWCIEHEAELPSLPNVSKEEIQEIVNNTYYLKKEKIPENILKGKNDKL